MAGMLLACRRHVVDALALLDRTTPLMGGRIAVSHRDLMACAKARPCAAEARWQGGQEKSAGRTAGCASLRGQGKAAHARASLRRLSTERVDVSVAPRYFMREQSAIVWSSAGMLSRHAERSGTSWEDIRALREYIKREGQVS